jgi:hypothetical protein
MGTLSTLLPRSGFVRRDHRRAGLSYVPAVNEMSAAMTASFLASPASAADCGFATHFGDPVERHKSSRPSVAQARLERRVAFRVPRSGVAKGRWIVLLPEGLLN